MPPMLMKQPKAAHATGDPILADGPLTALLILMIFLGSSLFLMGTARAASASMMAPQIPLTGYCDNPNPSSGHCYAERYWPGHTGGANTLINPTGALRCSGCTGFIDDEMWFIDNADSRCTSTQYGECWVEAGVSTYPANDPYNCYSGVASTCLFWADNRPNPGSYHEHPMFIFGVDGIDLSPYLIYITIYNDTGFSSDAATWDVSTNIYKNGSWWAGPSGQSTSNSMNVNKITIGSELSDSRGYADHFYFQYNQWRGSTGSWNYQTTDGTNDSTHAPPHGDWSVHPCNCTGNTGGSFETYDAP